MNGITAQVPGASRGSVRPDDTEELVRRFG